MNRVLVQAKKEWSEFKRDRLSLALAFLLPVFSLLLFGYGIRLECKNIPLVVRDFDSTSVSREYIERLYAANLFEPVRWSGADSPIDAIDSGLAKVAVIVPPEFTRRLLRGETATLPVLIDGTDINNAQVVYNTIKAATARYLETLDPFKRAIKGVVPELRVWFNPGRKESLFIVTGVIGVVLWMYPCLLAAVAASREKEQETIIRVFSSRLSALQFLAGKALVYFVVGMVLAVLVGGLSILLFGLSPVGDLTPLLLGTPIYLLVSVLFGLFVGTYSNSQTTAVQATSTAGFFPCLLLSGFVYPISNIPFPLSLFSLFVPARYYIELSRDAFVRGAGWVAVWQDPLVLMIFAALLVAVSWYGLRNMQLKD